MENKITRDQAEEIEMEKNVVIDIESMSYNTGSRDDQYGWQPIPARWIN